MRIPLKVLRNVYFKVFDLGHRRESMAMECILVYDRFFLCAM